MYQYNDARQFPQTEYRAAGIQQPPVSTVPQATQQGTVPQQPPAVQPQSLVEPHGAAQQGTTVQPQSSQLSRRGVEAQQGTTPVSQVPAPVGSQPTMASQQPVDAAHSAARSGQQRRVPVQQPVAAPMAPTQQAAAFQERPSTVQQAPQSPEQIQGASQQSSPTQQFGFEAQPVPASLQAPQPTAQGAIQDSQQLQGSAAQPQVPTQYGSFGGFEPGSQPQSQSPLPSGTQPQGKSPLIDGSQFGAVPGHTAPVGNTSAQQPPQTGWQGSSSLAGSQSATPMQSGTEYTDPQSTEMAAQQPVGQQGMLGQQASGVGQQAPAGGQIGGAVPQQAGTADQQGLHAASTQMAPQELEKPTERGRRHLTGMPNVDIFETPDTVTIYADVPGSKSEELEILANDNAITLLAKRDEVEVDDAEMILQERPTEFRRSITLPAVADVDAAEATHEDGICKITLPKREEARQKRIGFQ